jgi:DNA-binding LacI/PurR family transcriptional regulator
MRQPLVQLGHGALTTLTERIRQDGGRGDRCLLQAELVIRRSTGAPSNRP